MNKFISAIGFLFTIAIASTAYESNEAKLFDTIFLILVAFFFLFISVMFYLWDEPIDKINNF